MNGKGNLATVKEDIFTGIKQKRDITDKPNNIRAPIGFGDNARY